MERTFSKMVGITLILFLVAMSWIPTGGAFSSFRAFRVLRALRALRLITRLQKLRIIVQAIIESIPNVGWASFVIIANILYFFNNGDYNVCRGIPGVFWNDWKKYVLIIPDNDFRKLVNGNCQTCNICFPICLGILYFFYINFIFL